MIVGLLVEGLVGWFGSTTVFGWLCLLTCCVGWVGYGCFVCLLVALEICVCLMLVCLWCGLVLLHVNSVDIITIIGNLDVV